MNFKMIFAALEVIKKGRELADPAKWKNVQTLTNLVSVVVMLLYNFVKQFFFPELDLDQFIPYIKEIVVSVFLMLNAYFTMATSKKVGTGKQED